MPSQTLKQYIQRTSDEELKKIDNIISVEMSRRSLKIQAGLLDFDFDKISYFMNWSLFNEEQLSTILHNVVEELNRQKAERQNVDVGFWDSDGNYKEDIQEIDETDEWTNSKNGIIVSCDDSDLLAWFKTRKETPILKSIKNQFLQEIQKYKQFVELFGDEDEE